MPPHPTFFLKRSLYERYGNYRLDMGTAADYELMLRMMFKQQVVAAYVPNVLVHMRSRGVSNASMQNRIKANLADRRAWKVNEIKPRPWTLTLKPLRKLTQWF